MRRMLMVVVMLGSAVAFAQADEERHGAAERPGSPEGEVPHDVPGFILHHVGDAHEYEFEVPLASEHNILIPLPHLRVPFKAGACDAVDAGEGSWQQLADGCLDLSITKHTVMMWLASFLLVLAFVLGAHRNKSNPVPRGPVANLLEMLVLFVRDEIATPNIGKEYGPRFTPYLLTAFFFILFMNLVGLIPWMATPTGNLAVTAALAACTFFITQYAAIRAAGLGTYLKHLTGGVHFLLWPIMIPVEVLGLFTKPFALTVRLFANMVAGHIVIFFLLGLIFILGHPAVAVMSVPLALAIYMLELFVALVQAYIFTMLSAVFIGMGVAMAHHAEHNGHDHGDHHVEGSHSHDHGRAHHLG